MLTLPVKKKTDSANHYVSVSTRRCFGSSIETDVIEVKLSLKTAKYVSRNGTVCKVIVCSKIDMVMLC